jgi:excisionase family DNA binding protein
MSLERQNVYHGSSVQPGVLSLRALMTLDQVAELLRVSKGWVRDHATRRSPRLPVVRFGGRRAVLRFRPQDVERFIAEHLVSTERSI